MSLLLSAIIGIEQFAFTIPVISQAISSASTHGEVPFPSVIDYDDISANLLHDDSLFDNGDGTFTFSSRITSEYSYSDLSASRLRSKDGEFLLDKKGKYLIELWGGDGGDGNHVFPVSFKSGVGGKGGFVYGLLTVDEPDTKKLVYEIGSKGESKTVNIYGGGTGGIGGGAGDLTIISVGAGGGYSAVYLLDENEELDDADPIYGDKRDNPDKVIMIAGGGGGGGAGAAPHTLPGLFGGGGVANGGNGGSDESDIKGVPKGVPFSNGTYFAGANGKTTGTSTAYVGQGGTDKPGELTKDFLGFIDSTMIPNDWSMTYSAERPRGSGGAGNLRGGGGGAGFAGGSGGLQNAPITARNVGGGGGGSSYINNAIPNFTGLAEEAKDSMFFLDKNGNSNDETGGAIVIRYLPENEDYSFLNSVKITGTISEYFDIVAHSNNVTIDPDDPNKISAIDDISPKKQKNLEQGQANTDKPMVISLVLKPKVDFTGGDNVPVFSLTNNNNTFECQSMNDSSKKCEFLCDDDVSYVNVPYNVNFTPYNFVKGLDETYGKDDLYKGVVYDPSDPMYSFITGISYKVYDGDEEFDSHTVVQSDVDEVKQKSYYVKATVTPKEGTGKAKVGTDDNNNVITKKAVVRYSAIQPLDLDGLDVYPKKSLVYNAEDDTYELNIDVKVESQKKLNSSFYVFDPIASRKGEYQSGTYRNQIYDSDTISPKTISNVTFGAGYYYVEAFGGDGGTGGHRVKGVFGTGWDIPGTAGGRGGYVSGYIYLDAATKFTIYVGQAGYIGGEGVVSATDSYGLTSYYPGGGGEYSGVYIGNEKVIVAGGGGGGGSAYGTGITAGGSKEPTEPGYPAGAAGETGVRKNTTYNPKDLRCGENGQWDGDNAYVAKGGQNSRGSRVVDIGSIPGNFILPDTDNVLTEESLNNLRKKASNGIKSGAVRITKLAVKGGYGEGNAAMTFAESITDFENEHKESANILKNAVNNFVVTSTFSKYFDIISSKTVNSFDADHIQNVSDQTVTDTFDLPSSAVIEDIDVMSDFTPFGGEYTDVITEKRTYNYALETSGHITYKLKPKAGFLGGNDVPLLEKVLNEETSPQTAIKFEHHNTTVGADDDVGYVAALHATDYANVELYDGVEWELDNGNDIVVDYGTFIQKAALGASITDPTDDDPDTWQDDFVTFSDTITPDTYGTVTQDTAYTLSAKLSPKVSEPQALVRTAMDEKKTATTINVRVRYTISQELTGYDASRPNNEKFTIDEVRDDGYVIYLTPRSGYVLPNTPTVSVRGTNDDTAIGGVAQSVSDGTITVTIPKESIDRNITISANAVPTPHKVHYLYEVYDPYSNQISSMEAFDDDSYFNGDIIDQTTYTERYKQSEPYPNECDGYYWEWNIPQNDDGEYIMEDSDVYVIGRFKEKTVKLTVNYLDQSDTQLHKPYVSPDVTDYDAEMDMLRIALKPGATYSVKSPEIEGYYTETPVLAGTISNFNETKNVYYKPRTSDLIIYVLSCNEFGIADGTSRVVESKDAINVDTNTYQIFKVTRLDRLDGGATTEVKLGDVDDIGTNGTYYVYYRVKPHIINVTFDKNDDNAILGGNAVRRVAKGREYSYDPDNDDYIGMPKVVCSDKIFTGWYTEPDDGQGERVKDDDIVRSDTDIVLYAHWRSNIINISVDHKYANNISNIDDRGVTFDNDTENIIYGKVYTFFPRTVAGLIADKEKINGIAIEDTDYTFYYSDNSAIELEVNIYGEWSRGASEPRKLKGGKFALLDENGVKLENSEKINSSGVLKWSDLEFPIDENATYTVVCITPPSGYAAASVPISMSDRVKELYLERSPFRLPMAGSTPLTGYTVLGISIMLISGLLLFKYTLSESEENKK